MAGYGQRHDAVLQRMDCQLASCRLSYLVGVRRRRGGQEYVWVGGCVWGSGCIYVAQLPDGGRTGVSHGDPFGIGGSLAAAGGVMLFHCTLVKYDNAGGCRFNHATAWPTMLTWLPSGFLLLFVHSRVT